MKYCFGDEWKIVMCHKTSLNYIFKPKKKKLLSLVCAFYKSCSKELSKQYAAVANEVWINRVTPLYVWETVALSQRQVSEVEVLGFFFIGTDQDGQDMSFLRDS